MHTFTWGNENVFLLLSNYILTKYIAQLPGHFRNKYTKESIVTPNLWKYNCKGLGPAK